MRKINGKFRRVKPMMAELGDKSFNDADWLFELKWDGYRAIAVIGEEIDFYSRNFLSFKEKFPTIVKELSKVKYEAIFDGEVVAVDRNGKAHFQYLQDNQKSGKNIIYFVFDLLYFDGHSLLNVPLIGRKQILKKIIPNSASIKFSDHVEDKGIEFFRIIKEQGLEGMIAKKKQSAYLPGKRTRSWLKIKNILEDEAIICGYTKPAGGRKYFGSLVLGAYRDRKLVYLGNVGTGFDELALKNLYEKFQKLVQAKSPFLETIRNVVWLEPKLVCEIKYAEKTKDGYFRQPVFLGLREDKDPKEVIV